MHSEAQVVNLIASACSSNREELDSKFMNIDNYCWVCYNSNPVSPSTYTYKECSQFVKGLNPIGTMRLLLNLAATIVGR